jgi:hypothetical protein
MNPVKSLTAILGGILVVFAIGQVLEIVLVMAVADPRPENYEQYLRVRERTAIQIGILISHAIAAVLGGYIAARIVGVQEMTHATVAAVLQIGFLLWGFAPGENAAMTPMWNRIALVLVTVPAMLAGASVRAKARAFQETT